MSKEYPSGPLVGVGGVVVRGDRALIVKRGHEPRRGEWSIPGGLVELGEPLTDAVRRELREETDLDVEVGPIIETFDRIHHDASGRVRFHFVIIDFVCRAPAGEPKAGTDAEAVAWVGESELEAYAVNAHAAAVIRKAIGTERERPFTIPA